MSLLLLLFHFDKTYGYKEARLDFLFPAIIRTIWGIIIHQAYWNSLSNYELYPIKFSTYVIVGLL